jgi:hypothetical protein
MTEITSNSHRAALTIVVATAICILALAVGVVFSADAGYLELMTAALAAG